MRIQFLNKQYTVHRVSILDKERKHVAWIVCVCGANEAATVLWKSKFGGVSSSSRNVAQHVFSERKLNSSSPQRLGRDGNADVLLYKKSEKGCC